MAEFSTYSWPLEEIAMTQTPASNLRLQLVPPNLDYAYFAQSSTRPFESRATAWSPTNASWLADMSLLAYAPSDDVRTRCAKAGFHLEDRQPLSGPSTQCYVAHSSEAIIVAFRGTEVPRAQDKNGVLTSLRSSVFDVLRDIEIWRAASDVDADIHAGFVRALDEVWTPLTEHVMTLLGSGSVRPVWITGHSLGAALATLAAHRFAGAGLEPQGVYTYGSPRVGTETFAKSYALDDRTFRIVHCSDVVAHVPPPLELLATLPRFRSFTHVGQVRFIRRTGTQLETTVPDLDWPAPTPIQLLKPLDEVLRGLIEQRAVQWIIDHSPTLYAERLAEMM
jgi:hypothetical protein